MFFYNAIIYIIKNLKIFLKKISNFLKIKIIFSNLSEFFKKLLKLDLTIFENNRRFRIWPIVVEFFKKIINWLVSAITKLIKFVVDFIRSTKLYKYFNELWGRFKKFIEPYLDKFKAFIEPYLDRFKAFIKPYLDRLEKFLEKCVDFLKKKWNVLKKKWSQFKNFIAYCIRLGMRNILKNIFNYIKDYVIKNKRRLIWISIISFYSNFIVSYFMYRMLNRSFNLEDEVDLDQIPDEIWWFMSISVKIIMDVGYTINLASLEATHFLEYTEEWWDYIKEQIKFIIDNGVVYSIKYFIKWLWNYIMSSTLPLFFFGFTLFLSSTIISLFFLSRLGLYGVFVLNLITIFIFWCTTIVYFKKFFYENLFYKITVGKWFTILNGVDVFFDLYVDSVSYSFMLLTITIATAVYVYVYSYFRYEPNIERLSLLINLFVISMVVLVMSGNFFVLFFGWEMIGITSFLLINFWSTKISSLKSAFKAYTFNKFSDLCLFLAVIYSFILINDSSIIVFNFQIIEYVNFYITTPFFKIQMIELLSFLFITAAFVKSAQFGFHIWLPDSMDAPVPASALIHSATLVSAGVFILLRLTILFELSIYATYVIPLVGSFTAFIGGLGAVYQSDIKRILAYSTISHCGFLMVCFSLHVPEYTVLYLYIHGFFKAAVFLCAGNIIRFSRNYQDFRKMGSFWKYLPFEFYASCICLSNLCGLPFTLGFYIKHLILVVLGNDSFLALFVLVNIFIAAIAGLIYSYKFFFYIFLDKKKTNKYVYAEVSRPYLSSNFYSNTTLAPICAITFLITCSFIISLLLFNCFLKKNSIGEGLDINSFYNFSYLELNWPSKNFLNNVGYFNWFVILTVIAFCLNTWRISSNGSTVLANTNIITVLLLVGFFTYLI